MNKLLLLLFLQLLSIQYAASQTLAVTERGDTIYVYDDGTWSFSLEETGNYLDDEFTVLEERIQLDTLTTSFVVPKGSNKEIKSKFDFFKIKYDEKVWKRIPPGELNNDAEMALQARDKDVYCMVISEEIEIGDLNVLKIALNNMREATGGSVELVKSEVRTVNGKQVIHGIFNLEMSGLKMIFDSYYYSDESGTVQFTTWTGANLWSKYQNDIQNLLNGFVVE